MKWTMLLSVYLFISTGLGIGCSTPEKKQPESGSITAAASEPAWVSDPYALYPGDRAKIKAGVGNVKSPSRHDARIGARNRAKVEISESIRTTVESMVTDYTTRAQDFMDPGKTSVIENAEAVSRLITKEVLENADVDKYWVSPDGETFALVVLDYERMLQGYQARMAKLLAERFKEESADQREKALKALDAQVEKMKGEGFKD